MLGMSHSFTLVLLLLGLTGVHGQVAAGRPTCRWSWRRMRCVTAAGDASSCTFNLRHLRCTAKASVVVQSKATQSKVAPGAPTEQQQKKTPPPPQQQQQQPQAAAAESATQQQQQQQQQQQPPPQQQPPQQPAYMAPLHRGVSLQRAQRWAEAVTAYEEALAAATTFRSDAERVQILVAINTNLGLSLQARRSPPLLLLLASSPHLLTSSRSSPLTSPCRALVASTSRSAPLTLPSPRRRATRTATTTTPTLFTRLVTTPPPSQHTAAPSSWRRATPSRILAWATLTTS